LGRLGQKNADDIEAHFIPLDAYAPGVVAAGVGQVTLLFRIHRPIRTAEIRRRACLDLHEYERVAMPGHQVDFAAARIGAVPPRHDRTAVAPQVPVGEIFSDAAVVIGQTPAPQSVSCPIEQTDHLSTSNSNSITFPRTK
jgi:hypothetical protein